MTIIGIMAALVLGAMNATRNTAREAATKATIAKLNNIIMQRYESYLTRRVPVNLSGLNPDAAAKARLYAIRDLMRMEMPDRIEDILDPPVNIPALGPPVPVPALTKLYNSYKNAHYNAATVITDRECAQAAMLYMVVSLGSPEAMEQFNQSEIGDYDNDGIPEFLDGWGRPIFWLRWAPAFSKPLSDIQENDPVNHHDPFDPRRQDPEAFHLIPLIYSGGPNGEPGLNIKSGFNFNGAFSDTNALFSNSEFREIGTPSDVNGKGTGTLTDYQDNITNHHIESR